MANLTKLLVENSNDKMEIKSQVELNGQPFTTFKYRVEQLNPIVQAVVIYEENIGGETLIWGNSSFGNWNEFKWGNSASQSFILGNESAGILGTSRLGSRDSSPTELRVVPPNNKFREHYVTEFFINTTSTTATFGQHSIFFDTTDKVLISRTIYSNATSVLTARLLITATSGASNFQGYLSNDGASTWEPVTQQAVHTFTSEGENVLYKLQPISPNQYLNYLEVDINP